MPDRLLTVWVRYKGDTVDDMRAALNAGIKGLGVIAPGTLRVFAPLFAILTNGDQVLKGDASRSARYY